MGKYDSAPTVAAGLIRLARDKAGLTQTELANLAGVEQQVISAYETGRRDPTLQTLFKLVGAAGYEVRMRLEPIDDHDQSVEALLRTLSLDERAELEAKSAERTAEARLRRIRSH